MSRSLAQFSQDLRKLPQRVGMLVAERAAPEITALAQRTYLAGEDPYGVPWTPSSDGHRVTLYKDGRLFKRTHYVAIGTKLRVALGVPYAKYQIGKRPVFPTQGGLLPKEYTQALQRVSSQVCRQEIGPR